MHSLPKKRVLIVDDEEHFTKPLQDYLEQTGLYDVRVRHRGADALPAARQFRPDLVLLDVMMPDMDGGDVAAQMREDALLKDVPVVFLTAAITKDEAGPQGTTSGGSPCLAKPVTAEEVLACVRRHIRE